MKGNYYTMKELNKLKLVQRVISKDITGKEASEILGVSERQVRRIVRKVKTLGDVGIKHQNTFHKPVRTVPIDIKRKIIDLKNEKYPNCNFKHFRDILEEHERISYSYTTIYYILNSNGITSKKCMKRRKNHRLRPRKESFFELLQLDASKHDWLSNGKYLHLHGSIDDASGKITGLFFDKEETTNAYFEIMKQTIKNYGLPIALYVDGRATFFPAKDEKLTEDEQLAGKEFKLTQFSESMSRLGISVIRAHSSQAKGRIERLWQTLQDRLIVELKLNNISDINAANEYVINNFIPRFNDNFSLKVEKSLVTILKEDISLDLVLAKRYTRRISSSGYFSYGGEKYYIIDANLNLVDVNYNDTMEVIETTSGLYKISYDKLYYDMINVKNYWLLIEFKNKDVSVKDKRLELIVPNTYECEKNYNDLLLTT